MENRDSDHLNALRNELLYLIKTELTPTALKYQYAESPLEVSLKTSPRLILLGDFQYRQKVLDAVFSGTDSHKKKSWEQGIFQVFSFQEEKLQGLLSDDKVRQEEEQLPPVFSNHFKESGFIKNTCLSHPALQGLTIVSVPYLSEMNSTPSLKEEYNSLVESATSQVDLVFCANHFEKQVDLKELNQWFLENNSSQLSRAQKIYFLYSQKDCQSVRDILTPYGEFCWGLGKLSHEKKFPTIHFISNHKEERDPFGLYDKDSLPRELLSLAPKARLDNLINQSEEHSFYLTHLMEGLITFTKRKKVFYLSWDIVGAILCLFGDWYLCRSWGVDIFSEASLNSNWILGIVIFTCSFIFWRKTIVNRILYRFFLRKVEKSMDRLTDLSHPKRRQSWQKIKLLLLSQVRAQRGVPSGSRLKKEYRSVKHIYKKGTKEIKLAIKQMGDQQISF